MAGTTSHDNLFCDRQYHDAGESLVTVMPVVRLEKLEFIEREYGPLLPGIEIQVPMWLGDLLQRRRVAYVQLPQLPDGRKISSQIVEELVAQERSQAEVVQIGDYFFEQCYAYLGRPSDPHAESCDRNELVLLKEAVFKLRKVRQSKLTIFLKSVDQATKIMDLGWITTFELADQRRTVMMATDYFANVWKEKATLQRAVE
mmetsp:Transcript_23134/g.56243  ORF Transcript_23134/g.56243 Transcript_23134/m.56243 type:complete len:201 (-) Transcript_23134:186-788(-)